MKADVFDHLPIAKRFIYMVDLYQRLKKRLVMIKPKNRIKMLLNTTARVLLRPTSSAPP